MGLDGWKEATRTINRMADLMAKNLQVAEFDAAQVLRDGMRQKIYQGDPSWPPNAPITVSSKGSSKPLVGNGDLARGITVRRNSTGSAVGVFPGERKDGVDLATIARVQELGITILPKKVKLLAVPVNPRAARAQRQYGSVRNIPGLVHPKGTRIIGKEVRGSKKAGRRFEIWFVLLPKVKILPRSFFWSTVRAMQGRIRHMAAEAAEAALYRRLYPRHSKGEAA